MKKSIKNQTMTKIAHLSFALSLVLFLSVECYAYGGGACGGGGVGGYTAKNDGGSNGGGGSVGGYVAKSDGGGNGGGGNSPGGGGKGN